MLNRRFLAGIFSVLYLNFAVALSVAQPDPSANTAETRVNQILSQMTLEEKIDLISGMGMSTRPLARLGVPALKMSDGPVGAHLIQPSTAYAAGIALAASWDPALAEEVGRQVGRDARSRGANFLLGPGVNIYRAPMNGRNFEYFGEDPFLAGKIAVGYIEGVQAEGVGATIKHYMGNNSEYARNSSNSVIDERTMREIYLPVFEAAVKEAKVAAVMCSYNLTNGLHMCENGHLNNEILKGDWKFNGLLMSDWGATHDAVKSANNGLDLEMPAGSYMIKKALLPAIQQGQVSEATIDDKVRRLLRVAIQFGWLDKAELDIMVPRYNQEGRIAALQGAKEGMVLLKNDGSLLPLDETKIKTVALIGPRAYPATPTGGGSAAVETYTSVSYLTAISDYLGSKVNVVYDCGLPTVQSIARSTRFSTQATGGQQGVTVETFNNGDFSGTPSKTSASKRAVIGSSSSGNPFGGGGAPGAGPGGDMAGGGDAGGPPEGGMPGDGGGPDMGGGPGGPGGPGRPGQAAASSTRITGYFNAETAGDYLIMVQDGQLFRLLVDDQVVIDNSVVSQAGGLHKTISLSAGVHKVVLNHVSGGGPGGPGGGGDNIQLGIANTGKLVTETARKMAAAADAVVVAVGFDNASEGEGSDRTFDLPPGQDELIRQIAAINKNTIVVVTAGGAVNASPWIDKVPALIESWYSGEDGGTALAQLLFGKADFSGRLPISWERDQKDNPSSGSYYYSDSKTQDIHYSEGIFTGYRGYERNHVKPLFPFGFGLSYTTFKYGNLSIHPAAENAASGPGPFYEVSFDITNTGQRAGADVAQVYVGDSHARIDRPARELKGFQRVELEPGQTRQVKVMLNGRAFTYFDTNVKHWHADPGEFSILVGRSVEDIQLTGKIDLTSSIDIGVDK
jgi:beta-glucosidase